MMSNQGGHHQGLAQSLTCAVGFFIDEDLLSEKEGHSWESQREEYDLGPAKMQMDRHQKVKPWPPEVIF